MTKTISAERAVYDLPAISSPRVSPEGSFIAYLRTVVDRSTGKYDSQVWIASLDDGTRKQVSQSGPSHSDPVWSPAGNNLAFVASEVGDNKGDYPHVICRMALPSGETTVLTRHSKKPCALAWNPDGTSIAYTLLFDPDNPDETPIDKDAPKPVRVTRRIDYKQDGFGYLNNVRQQVFIVDAHSGDRRQLTTTHVDHLQPAWSPDGKLLVVMMPNRNGMLSQLGVITIATDEISEFGSDNGEVGAASFAPDSSRLFLSADDHGGPQLSGYLLDLQSGSMINVIDDPDFLIDSTTFPVWLDERTVLIGAQLGGQSGLWTINVETCSISTVGLWESGHGDLSVPDSKAFAIQSINALGGTVGLIQIDLSNGERTVLFNDAEDFYAETPAAGWEKCPIDSDGVTIDAWLIKPANFDPAKTYPLIINIHGGPHGAFGFTTNLHVELMASRGYLVLLVNPRGSTTYGSAYANAVKRNWGGVDWADLEAVLDHVVARSYVDPDRTGAYGYSYGGYMTSWILGHTDRFKAVVCGAPVFDLESFFGTSDIGHVFGDEQHGAPPWISREDMFERSPSSHILKATTPTLIVHGESDERCPIGQGEQMFISLLKAGCEVEFVRYPGGYHGFTRLGEPAHRIDYYDRTIAWFDRFLLDTPSNLQ